jgi:hypothetical protein
MQGTESRQNYASQPEGSGSDQFGLAVEDLIEVTHVRGQRACGTLYEGSLLSLVSFLVDFNLH